jgi:membrane-associated phospholipid phosphatase
MISSEAFSVLGSKLLPIIIFLFAYVINPIQSLFIMIEYIFISPSYKKISYYLGFASKRPYNINEPLTMQNNGMPSGHASLAFTFASINNFKPIPTIIAVLTALQRIHSGAHSKTQVFIGAIIGTFTGKIFNWIENNRNKIRDYILGNKVYI